MENVSNFPVVINPPPGAPEQPRQRGIARQRPEKSLPTDRLRMDVQQRVLRAYATLSGRGKRAVTAQDIGRSLNISAASAGLCNGFFSDSGFIERKSKGVYCASDALLDYSARQAISPDDPEMLRPLQDQMRMSWYWTVLSDLVPTTGISSRDAVYTLLREAGASEHHLPQIQNLVAWLYFAGLIKISDGILRLVDIDATSDAELAQTEVAPEAALEADKSQQPATKPAGTNVQESTNATPGQPPGVALSFNFQVWLTSDDLARLDPEQIRATFEAARYIGSPQNGPEELS